MYKLKNPGSTESFPDTFGVLKIPSLRVEALKLTIDKLTSIGFFFPSTLALQERFTSRSVADSSEGIDSGTGGLSRLDSGIGIHMRPMGLLQVLAERQAWSTLAVLPTSRRLTRTADLQGVGQPPIRDPTFAIGGDMLVLCFVPLFRPTEQRPRI
ncbi:hypothetical protein FOPE_01898 [Fonsecaea pedrosoi]|nr:hypothetical protein FOPE_01898 [Fonsecaea pedrosoi]